MKLKFKEYIYSTNVKGSKKASSYIRALDMLGEILLLSEGPFKSVTNLWDETSVIIISSLYEHILQQQKSGEIFNTPHAPSYWRNGYYSAGLKSYRNFLVENNYEQALSNIYEESKTFKSNDFEVEVDAKEVLVEGLDKTHGKEVIREVKTRVGQSVFRKQVLKIYENQCCITGLNIPQINRASHIIPWREREDIRLDPSNGLCLSATYDAAFDQHLFSLDEDYRIILSKDIKEHYTKEVVKEYFHKIEGQRISMPIAYEPKQEYLSKHRKEMAV